jgi:quercetin dioxygenase-like cupin family protein
VPRRAAEVQFIQQGRGLYTVIGETFEAGAGDIAVIKAGEVHAFRCIGDSPSCSWTCT